MYPSSQWLSLQTCRSAIPYHKSVHKWHPSLQDFSMSIPDSKCANSVDAPTPLSSSFGPNQRATTQLLMGSQRWHSTPMCTFVSRFSVLSYDGKARNHCTGRDG